MDVAWQPEDAHIQALNQLGLSLPPGLSSSPNLSREKALELYLAMVNKVAAKKVEQDKVAAKAAKEKDQLREAIRAKDPKSLFESAVKQAMQDMSKEVVDPRVDYALALASSEDPANHIDWSKSAPPPKRRFTKSALAQRKQAKSKDTQPMHSPVQKGKGKGKIQEKGKGNSKGNGQGKVAPYNPSKGFGKGKGYPQPKAEEKDPKDRRRSSNRRTTPSRGKFFTTWELQQTSQKAAKVYLYYQKVSKKSFSPCPFFDFARIILFFNKCNKIVFR